MKQTTKEQVTVTLLVDLEYENQEGRELLIQRLKDKVDGCDLNYFGCSWFSVPGSVTVSSNDESTILAWRVRYRDSDVVIRTVSWGKAKDAFIASRNDVITHRCEIEVERAPEFDWNSQLIPGNVYSLEQAEAGNKKQ